MKYIIDYLMLSCKKAALLIDKKAGIKLTMRENIQLSIHTSMCNACTIYIKQSLLIDKAMRNHLHAISQEIQTIIENKELKEQIISKL